MLGHIAFFGACALLLLGCATPPRLEPMLRFDMDGSPGTKVAFNRDADRLAGAAVNGHVYLWHLPEGRALTAWRVHRDSIHGLVFLKDGQLVSASYDQTLALWSADGKLLTRGDTGRRLARSPTHARDLVFSEDGRSLMGSGWFKLFRWNVDSGTLAVLPTDRHGLITSLDPVPGTSALASISRHTDSSVRLLDPHTGDTLRYVTTHDLCGAHVRLSPGGRYLASVSDDASVWVFALAQISLNAAP